MKVEDLNEIITNELNEIFKQRSLRVSADHYEDCGFESTFSYAWSYTQKRVQDLVDKEILTPHIMSALSMSITHYVHLTEIGIELINKHNNKPILLENYILKNVEL
jgi:hypothetical protein